MKPATKVFAILSLSAAVGMKISKTGETDDIRGAGIALKEAGHEAAGKYPSAPLTHGRIEKVGDSVSVLLSNPMEPKEILSMLLAGLVDIYAKCNPARHELLDPLVYVIQACLDFYPGEIDHEAAFLRYEAWCEA